MYDNLNNRHNNKRKNTDTTVVITIHPTASYMSIVLFSCHLLQALHSLDVEKKRAAAAEEERNRAAAAAAAAAEAQRQRDAEAAAAKKAQEEAAAAKQKVRVTGCNFVI